MGTAAKPEGPSAGRERSPHQGLPAPAPLGWGLPRRPAAPELELRAAGAGPAGGSLGVVGPDGRANLCGPRQRSAGWELGGQDAGPPLRARRAVPPAPPPTPWAAGEGGGGGWATRWQLGGWGYVGWGTAAEQPGLRGRGRGEPCPAGGGARGAGPAAAEGPRVRFCTVMVGSSDATKWRLALPSRG